jgi:hypothetical protein
MLMHFFSRRDIEKRFRSFSKLTIDEMMVTFEGGKYVDHDYIVQASK